MINAASAIPITPVIILVINVNAPNYLFFAIGQAAKTTITPGIVHHSFYETLRREIRPVRIRKPELRISRLPEQEIRKALSATGADDQIDRQIAVRIEAGLDHRCIDFLWCQFTGSHTASYLLHR